MFYLELNSLRTGDATWRQNTWSILLQLMACDPNGAKPLSDLALTYCRLGHVQFSIFSRPMMVGIFIHLSEKEERRNAKIEIVDE